MAIQAFACWMLEQEARSLLTRLTRVKPFALLQPMVPAAALQPGAQSAIERHLAACRKQLKAQVADFLRWLASPEAQAADAALAQRRFTFLRLRFSAVLTHVDMFCEVITQRSESENGVWLAGLDVVCADALRLPGNFYHMPPVVCYLDRGPGAAIRRAGTRLPGGGTNPVAIVRIPRERMIGSGIASSLVHEVGHQGAALLDLAQSLGQQLRNLKQAHRCGFNPWVWWELWISEIVADFWAIARVGVASTLGLIAVLSLPRQMVMRLSGNDPHPVPWLRVKLSCAIGNALYPHPQWAQLAKLWESFYPTTGLPYERIDFFNNMQASIAAFVDVMVKHRPTKLQGHSMPEIFTCSERQPEQLIQRFKRWQSAPQQMYEAAPSLVFSVLGQARVAGLISPEQESDVLAKLLTHWALNNALNTSTTCAISTGALLRPEPALPRGPGLPGITAPRLLPAPSRRFRQREDRYQRLHAGTRLGWHET